jgi:Arabinose-binding domain of AraC transcription regulator, N-term
MELARSVGVDPYSLLNAAGISPEQLEDPETRLSATAVAGLLEETARQSGCEHFSLLIAQSRTFESLGSIAPVLERLGTLREVVEMTVRQRRRLNDVFEFNVIEGAVASFLEVIVLPQFAGSQAVTLTTAVTHVLLDGASHGRWKPRAVHFRRNAPRNTEIFAHFFGCPVRFESNIDGFEFDPSLLHRRWSEPNESDSAAGLIAGLEQQIAKLRSMVRGKPDPILEELEEIVAELRAEVMSFADE